MPAEQINPVAVDAMGEEGIGITGEAPKVLITEAVQASDVVIMMVCGNPARSSPASGTRTGRSTTPLDKARRRCAHP